MFRYFRSIPPVTANLLIINILLWLAMTVSPALTDVVYRHLTLHFYESDLFNLIQPVTYMFVHAGFVHLLFNMVTLFFFGPAMEYTFGSRRYLIYYMMCGVGAALIQEAVWTVTLPDFIISTLSANAHMPADIVRQELCLSPALWQSAYAQIITMGASGAIYGLLLAFGMVYPNRAIYFMFIPVPVKAKWMVLIWGGMELLLGMSNTADGVAHFAHLGGMIFGFMLITYWLKKGVIYRE